MLRCIFWVHSYESKSTQLNFYRLKIIFVDIDFLRIKILIYYLFLNSALVFCPFEFIGLKKY